MSRRGVRALVLGALVTVLVGAHGVPLASSEENDDPVGYTFGLSVAGPGAPALECNFYKVHLDSGALTQLNPGGKSRPCADGLTFDEDGTLYAYRSPNIDGIAQPAELITVDLDDGQEHVVGTLPPVFLAGGGMTFDAKGHLWLYAEAEGSQCQPTGQQACLWKVDPKNAHTDFVGPAPERTQVDGLAADCEDVIAYAHVPPIDKVGEVKTLAEVNTSNAGLEKLVDLDLPDQASLFGLDFDAEGKLWAVGTQGDGAVFLIDPDNGSTTAKTATVGGGPFNGLLLGLAVSPLSCEEPEPPAPPAPAPVAVAVQPVFTG